MLNDYFPNWHRLSFTYNVTPSAYYTYAPAYKRHGQDVNVLHFIGENKPWKRGTRGTYDPEAASKDYYDLVGQWFDVFERHFGSVLTYDVAGRVMPPPASFKSTFTSLPSHVPPSVSVPAVNVRPPSPPPSKPAPIPIPPSVAAGRTSPPIIAWDPSRSSPPRDGSFQMRDPIPAGYNNIWDDPAASRRPARFQPPEQYPQPPKETHDWYKAVMQAKPDPSAVKPVFPWEEPKTPTRATSPVTTSRKFGESPPPAIETPQHSQPPMSFRASSFTNAWDAIPAISKYADNLAKQTSGNGSKKSGGSTGSITPKAGGGRKSRSASASSGSAGPSSSASNGVTVSGGRTKGSTSNSGVPSYPIKGDASSRDGDDEDDEEADLSTTDQGDYDEEDSDSEERDRIAIKFRRAESSGVSPTNTRNRALESSSSLERLPDPPVSPPKNTRGLANSHLQKDSRYVPTSPRQPRSPPSSSILPPPVPGAPTHLGKPNLHLSLPSRSQLPQAGSGGQVSPRIAGVTSPRLAAQAIRNSSAARLVSSGSGHGDGPPVVRATRVFSPTTDTGFVKQQGLAALQRFVESMEAESNNVPAPDPTQRQQQPFAGGGGVGTGGAWRY